MKIYDLHVMDKVRVVDLGTGEESEGELLLICKNRNFKKVSITVYDFKKKWYIGFYCEFEEYATIEEIYDSEHFLKMLPLE